MSKLIEIEQLSDLAAKSEQEWKKHFAKNKKKIEKLDVFIHNLHNEISEKTDCLSCGNCCRMLGPRINDKDIERLSKSLRIKPVKFIEQYLIRDEDGDMIFKSMPCPFLGMDNYCAVYESRPKACREYPHTNRKKFFQIYNLSIKNAYTCPIVFQVLEKIKRE